MKKDQVTDGFMEFDIEKVEVLNNPEKNRFEVKIGAQLAQVDYMDRGALIVFTHTEVPSSLEGKGIASKMARAALDYARESGKEVMPLCPYIAAFIRRHPEYQDLVMKGFKY
ncbi:MAG: GNAT family N-acetyltransferase [Bacteroidota bacterium]